MLARLQTLKGAPPEELVSTLRALADQNPGIYDEIERLVAAESSGILGATVAEDRDKVVLAVLLAAVADDIGTLPAECSRARPLARLNKACRLLDLKYEDVYCLLEFMPAMRPVLDSRPGSHAGGE